MTTALCVMCIKYTQYTIITWRDQSCGKHTYTHTHLSIFHVRIMEKKTLLDNSRNCFTDRCCHVNLNLNLNLHINTIIFVRLDQMEKKKCKIHMKYMILSTVVCNTQNINEMDFIWTKFHCWKMYIVHILHLYSDLFKIQSLFIVFEDFFFKFLFNSNLMSHTIFTQ